MRIIGWPQFLEGASPLGDTAYTVGVFDGVHRGHKALIELAVSHAGTVPVVITFIQNSHKKARSGYHGDIMSLRQKTAIFRALDISITVVIEFSESFRHTSGAEFLRILHERSNMRYMAVGSDFRCGCGLDTDAAAIRDFNAGRGVPTGILPPFMEGDEPISSSRIRAAIAGGDLKSAAVMLGRPFTLDLEGSASAAGVYNIAGRGLILPPPGRYPVLLRGKDAEKPATALVEDGKLIFDGNPEDFRPEYAEF